MTVDTAPEIVAPGDLRLGILGTGVAVMAWGTSGVVVKAIDMGGLAIGFWRFSLYALLLVAYTFGRGGAIDRRVLRASMAGGICLGLDVTFFFTAIKLTTVVNATTIGAMQPLVVSVIAARFFGERIRGRDMLAGAVAIVAVVVIVFQSAGTPEWSGAGDLAAVGALFSWSGYFIFSKRSKGIISSLEYSAGTGVWSAGICLVIGLMARQDMSFPARTEWLPLVALALGAGILGHSVMNWSLVRIPLWLGSTLTLLIPVISSLTAWVFLDEPLTVVQLSAMGVVLGSLAVMVSSQTRIRPAPESAGTITP